MQRATGLIAAGALSLSLTPGIALAENDKGSEQQPVAEQQANSPAAGEDTAAATDNASAENGTAGEGGSDASNGAATAEAATPQTAPEAAPLATPVAQIGSTTYATLDEAVAAAAEGDVIELLADATTSGLNLSKNLTIGSATITNNGTGSINQGNIGAEFGGGINNVGTVVLDPSVQIYNNHASKAGDDLYSTGAGTTSFGDTGSSWILDDCNEAIDGWYTDEGCTEKWVDYTPLAGSMTLYGKWTKDPTPEPSTPTEPSQPGSQTSTDSNAQPQQASSTENLAQTGDATLPFGLAVTGIALAAGAVALISRRLLKH